MGYISKCTLHRHHGKVKVVLAKTATVSDICRMHTTLLMEAKTSVAQLKKVVNHLSPTSKH